jgi:hypothetical protein
MAIVHGLALGTSGEPVLRGTTIACAVVGVGAIAWRYSTSHHDEERRVAVAAQEWS